MVIVFLNKKINRANDYPPFNNKSLLNLNFFNKTNFLVHIRYYVISFFSGAWYLDIVIMKLAYYICFISLYVFYYIVDKGIIYLFGPEGWVSFFLNISKILSFIQNGVISKYVAVMLLFIFFIFFFI